MRGTAACEAITKGMPLYLTMLAVEVAADSRLLMIAA